MSRVIMAARPMSAASGLPVVGLSRLADWSANDPGINLSGSEVILVPDSTGNGYTLSQATSARRPLLVVGGGPQGRNTFDMRSVGGINKSLGATGLPGGAVQRTVFYVGHCFTNGVGYYYSQGIAGLGVLYAYPARVMYSGGGTNNVSDPGGFNVDCAVWNDASSRHAINGAGTVTGDPGSDLLDTIFWLNGYPGDPTNPVYNPEGYVDRVIVYDGAMSAPDEATITAYLMSTL